MRAILFLLCAGLSYGQIAKGIVGGTPLPPSGGGTVSIVSYTTACDGNTAPLVCTGINTTNANLLVCTVSNGSEPSPVFTDSYSNSWTALPMQASGGYGSMLMLYAWKNMSGGPLSVGPGHTFSSDVGGSYAQYNNCVAFHGPAITADPLHASSGSGPTPSNPTVQPGSITTTVTPVAIVTGVGSLYTNPATISEAGSSYTVLDSGSAPGNIAGGMAVWLPTGTVTTNPTWNVAVDGVAFIAAFKFQ